VVDAVCKQWHGERIDVNGERNHHLCTERWIRNWELGVLRKHSLSVIDQTSNFRSQPMAYNSGQKGPASYLLGVIYWKTNHRLCIHLCRPPLSTSFYIDGTRTSFCRIPSTSFYIDGTRCFYICCTLVTILIIRSHI